MGILDNLESYWEKSEQTAVANNLGELTQTEKCHYCQSKAKYTDIAPIDEAKYDIVGVCECHAFKGLSS